MKKKKTPKTTSTQPSKAALNDLPVIRIVSEEEEMHVKMELEMDDETHDMLVKWGKEVASDEDYINIAITDGLKHLISSDKQHFATAVRKVQLEKAETAPKSFNEKMRDVTLYTRALITPACTRKILIGEGMLIRTTHIMSNQFC